MRVSRLTISDFRGIHQATLHFDGHTLLIGANNVGKSTICDALDLVLGPDRMRRQPVAQEHDFYNSVYLNEDGTTVQITIEVVLTGLTDEVLRSCPTNIEFWDSSARRLLEAGELPAVDRPDTSPCLRLTASIRYDPDEDDFAGQTYYAHSPDAAEGELTPVPQRVKRSMGFLYLRALRTGARALSLERGSLLDIILKLKEVRTGLWEDTRSRLRGLNPPIDDAAKSLGPVLDAIEQRVGEYIALEGKGRATRLFVSQLTREHLRHTLSFFLSMTPGQEPVPFQQVGTGTLNTLVLALLSFIAETKGNNVIFAMEEPEIALPPHTQRRIATYLLTNTAQCFVTSHSPYVIECFEPERIMLLRRADDGSVAGLPVVLPAGMRLKTYHSQLRRSIAEAMLAEAVIVVEGTSERQALTVVARKLESTDPVLFPLDVAGVTIVNVEGDGNLSAFGTFFRGLNLQAFALYDQKPRKDDEAERIRASFDSSCEIPYRGLERLLASELPLDRQWTFLNNLQAETTAPAGDATPARPDDDELRERLVDALRQMKGEGGAARLLDSCAAEELPVTLRTFLLDVYARFPRPVAKRDPLADPATSSAPLEDGASPPSGT